MNKRGMTLEEIVGMFILMFFLTVFLFGVWSPEGLWSRTAKVGESLAEQYLPSRTGETVVKPEVPASVTDALNNLVDAYQFKSINDQCKIPYKKVVPFESGFKIMLMDIGNKMTMQALNPNNQEVGYYSVDNKKPMIRFLGSFNSLTINSNGEMVVSESASLTDALKEELFGQKKTPFLSQRLRYLYKDDNDYYLLPEYTAEGWKKVFSDFFFEDANIAGLQDLEDYLDIIPNCVKDTPENKAALEEMDKFIEFFNRCARFDFSPSQELSSTGPLKVQLSPLMCSCGKQDIKLPEGYKFKIDFSDKGFKGFYLILEKQGEEVTREFLFYDVNLFDSDENFILGYYNIPKLSRLDLSKGLTAIRSDESYSKKSIFVSTSLTDMNLPGCNNHLFSKLWQIQDDRMLLLDAMNYAFILRNLKTYNLPIFFDINKNPLQLRKVYYDESKRELPKDTHMVGKIIGNYLLEKKLDNVVLKFDGKNSELALQINNKDKKNLVIKHTDINWFEFSLSDFKEDYSGYVELWKDMISNPITISEHRLRLYFELGQIYDRWAKVDASKKQMAIDIFTDIISWREFKQHTDWIQEAKSKLSGYGIDSDKVQICNPLDSEDICVQKAKSFLDGFDSRLDNGLSLITMSFLGQARDIISAFELKSQLKEWESKQNMLASDRTVPNARSFADEGIKIIKFASPKVKDNYFMNYLLGQDNIAKLVEVALNVINAYDYFDLMGEGREQAKLFLKDLYMADHTFVSREIIDKIREEKESAIMGDYFSGDISAAKEKLDKYGENFFNIRWRDNMIQFELFYGANTPLEIFKVVGKSSEVLLFASASSLTFEKKDSGVNVYVMSGDEFLDCTSKQHWYSFSDDRTHLFLSNSFINDCSFSFNNLLKACEKSYDYGSLEFADLTNCNQVYQLGG